MRRPALIGIRFAVAALLIAAGAPALLRAQDDAPPPDPDTPERGVARISLINGEVSVRRGDSGEWVAAALNAPLMVDDRLSTGAGARAEVQFDSANLIRVGANAEIRLARLEYGHYTVQIAHGTITFRVLRDSHAQVELETPPVSVTPLQIGSYRIYVQDGDETEITVREGSVEIYTPKGTEQLQQGQTMLARGDPADPEFRIVPAIAHDQWDTWNEQRDGELLSSASTQHVPQDEYGAEDLDAYGQWVDMPPYGYVWSPAVGPDWAPYQYGRWVWEDWYGWTWISYDPWGWTPFHYGRWFFAANYGWCWYPGRFGRHYWSPALVGFFGFGGAGVGFGFANIGWVPLAPFERLHPWWGRGFYGAYRNGSFNHNLSIANANIRDIYRNARVANGVASVRAADFQQGRFGNISRVTPVQMRDAGLVRGQLPMAPSSANLRYTDHAVSRTPRSPENVRFFSHSKVAPVQRVPFGQQQRVMQQFSRQPSTRSGAARSSSAPSAPSTGPARNPSPGVASSETGSAPHAWRPLNTPQSTPSNRTSSDPRPAQNSGWRRFGEPRSTTPAPAPRSYWNTPRPGNSTGNYRPYTAPNYSRPQSIQIAPRVVRERPAPRSEVRSAPRSGGSGGGFRGGSSHGGGGGSHGGGHR